MSLCDAHLCHLMNNQSVLFYNSRAIICNINCYIPTRKLPLVTKHTLTQIFIKYMHDIVLQISFLDINSQNWITGSCLKLWQEMAKTQWRCDQISNIPSRGWRACKNWFFMLTTFLARGIFLIHHIWKKVK